MIPTELKIDSSKVCVSLNPVLALVMIPTVLCGKLDAASEVCLNPVLALVMIPTKQLTFNWMDTQQKSQSSISPGYDSNFTALQAKWNAASDVSQSSISPGYDSNQPEPKPKPQGRKVSIQY